MQNMENFLVEEFAAANKRSCLKWAMPIWKRISRASITSSAQPSSKCRRHGHFQLCPAPPTSNFEQIHFQSQTINHKPQTKGKTMKKSLVLGAVALLAGPLFAADATPKDDVVNAAKQVGTQTNYTWKTTVVVPEDAQFKPGPTDGETEKDGFTHVKMTFFDNPVQILVKGTKGAFTD